MSGVGQFKNGLLDNLTGRLGAEADGFVAVGRDDGELLDDVPVQVLALNLLACDVVERNSIEISEQKRSIHGGMPICRNDWECVSHSRTRN